MSTSLSSIAWPMVAGACLTLGLIELRIGLTQPPRAARLLFALSAFVVAGISGLELALMKADVLADWWLLMRRLDIAVGAMMVSLTAFIWVYFGTGNKWLALAVPGLYAVGLAFAYLPGSGMTYGQILGFRTVEIIGGATFTLVEGVPNPWNVFPYLAVLALILQQLRSQLAHASRVSLMGQLASALAHELSQPLGAILRNAEAAELFLAQDPPYLDELRAILFDIRQDDQRASGVIERLRALLKRGSLAPHALSVTDLLTNVAALTRADAAARKTRLVIAAAPGLPLVLGDAVHLQQVLLNLILNAMDAVQDLPAERRLVTVGAQRRAGCEVEVAVVDTGPGIAADQLGRLFEPFFTTKPNGMGIGLAISRTIIEAQGGRIWAENNTAVGATFQFTLPQAEGDCAGEQRELERQRAGGPCRRR